MKPLFALACLLLAATSALADDCALSQIEAALTTPLDGLNKLERDVTDVQSTEGGQWEIYRESDGRVNTIIRIDGGEMGRSELRLTILNRRTYGISDTSVQYTRHIAYTQGGPLGTSSRTTRFHYYCNGKPAIASSEALEVQESILKDKDVADFTKGLAR